MPTLRLEIGTPAGGAFQILLDPGEVELGRSAACAVRLPYPAVSGRHLRLLAGDDGWQVMDLGSKNGTLLDGRPLPSRQSVDLPDGSVLQISDVTITTSLSEQDDDGFTLTESGTMLRKLVAESATEAGAYLETGAGKRIEVPDFAAQLRPADSAPFLVDRRGHGFWVTALRDITIDGTPVDAVGCALDDGSTIVAGEESWTFHDPLQGLVEELDDAVEPATERRTPARAARPMDTLLFGIGLVTVVLAVAALLVVFEVV